MTQIHPLSLARKLYRNSRARRSAQEESRFRSRLQHEPQAPALVLSPHWDDAVLDCWSLLASDRELHVINVFSGTPAPGGLTIWDATTGAGDSAERARERIVEDALALARAGREPLGLSFLDAQYRGPPPAPTLEQFDLALTAHAGSACRVYVPAGLGGHVDHLLTRRYGRMLLRTGMPVELYADLPYCILHGWPHWVDGRPEQPNRNVDAFWSSFLQDVPEMPPLRTARVERLEDHDAAAKLAAMSCYRTQLPCLDYGARGLLSDPEIHRFEVRWELAAERSRASTQDSLS
jgi:hypothetical protein